MAPWVSCAAGASDARRVRTLVRTSGSRERGFVTPRQSATPPAGYALDEFLNSLADA